MGEKGTITVKVLFFASAREAAGNINQIDLDLVQQVVDDDENNNTNNEATTSGIRKKLAEMYPNLASMVLDEESITLALNEEYVPAGIIVPLKNGDTIALIPPISGG
jgi:molybdopterin converting factor small subunit